MRSKFLPIAVAALIFATPSAALASTRTPAEATAHAFDELANCYAQRRPECPTSTPSPIVTPSPTSTGTPRPTEAPTPELTATATPPTPEPCWLQDEDLGDPVNGYIVFDEDGAPVPCPTLTEETPIAEPTDTPTPVPPATPRPTPQPAPAAGVSAPAVQTVVVIQTVVVLVTPAPTDTRQPTLTATATRTPARSVTPTLTVTPTATRTATSTLVPLGAAAPAPVQTALATTELPWPALLGALGVIGLVMGAVWAGVAIKRRTVVRKPRPPREETYA